jgi:hypothetical protein
LVQAKDQLIDIKQKIEAAWLQFFYVCARHGRKLCGASPEKEVPSFVFPTLTGMSFLGIGCLFYCWKFIAKTLKIVELNRFVSRNEWFSDSVTFSFYPAGLWNLQPRVNKIFEKSSKPA